MPTTQGQARNLWSEVHRLQDEMERLVQRMGWNAPRPFWRSSYPAVNMWEDDNNIYVEAELPGFSLDELEITVTGERQLSLKGERQAPEIPDAQWHRQEREYGSFQRVLELPQAVDAERVTAAFEQGVLSITLPKREEVKPRRIQVKVT